MIPEQILVMTVIAVLSVVQSIFGMGILIFGTPTLLLMGYEFTTAVGCLLPASVAISFFQVIARGAPRVPSSRYLYTLCLPTVAVGLWMTETKALEEQIHVAIGSVLLASAALRCLPTAQRLMASALARHVAAYHIVMGLLHGLTNLGGAMLAILASGLHTDKNAIRKTVAQYYLAFGIVQITVLATVMHHHDVLLANLPNAIIAAAVYLVFGNRIFGHASEVFDHWAFTAFVALYGAALLIDFST